MSRARETPSHGAPDIGVTVYDFARPVKPCASIGILKIDFALFLTPGGVTISVPSG